MYMDNLQKLKQLLKHYKLEGNISTNKKQINDLVEICNNHSFINILEIGFNAGHSSVIMLENSNALITSIDIGSHNNYIDLAKKFVDEKYPCRHKLIIGDSNLLLDTIDDKYDFIFIDGGHDYKTCLNDLTKCRNLATNDCIIYMDDLVYENPKTWNKGVNRVWEEQKEKHFIEEIDYKSFNRGKGRGLCKYICSI